MAQQDAIALLDADHRKVEEMFAQYLSGGRHAHDRRELARMICHELTIHAQIEEEIFYPAVRRALGDDRMVDDAEKEHNAMREMINVIESGPYDDELVVQLQRAVMHHVKEEREEMFDHARRTPGLDLAQLGDRLAQRKHELMAHA
jgi:hemerythrin superfamily protein